jgi:hypothetical protein
MDETPPEPKRVQFDWMRDFLLSATVDLSEYRRDKFVVSRMLEDKKDKKARLAALDTAIEALRAQIGRWA